MRVRNDERSGRHGMNEKNGNVTIVNYKISRITVAAHNSQSLKNARFHSVIVAIHLE